LAAVSARYFRAHFIVTTSLACHRQNAVACSPHRPEKKRLVLAAVENETSSCRPSRCRKRGSKDNADARKSGRSPDLQIGLESKLLARFDRIGPEPVLDAPGLLTHGDGDGLIDLQIRAGQGDILAGLLDATSVVLRVR
jgi:hypothetical protein